jgi:choline dehydrogenase
MGQLSTYISLVILTGVCFAQVSLPACPDTSQAEYDYVVVGAGAGGGPLAARLAESGFSGIFLSCDNFKLPFNMNVSSVLVVDAGHEVNNVNTTVPVYFGRAVDGLSNW